MITRKYTLLIIALCIFGLGWAKPVAAHGDDETLEVYRSSVGPYYLSSWSFPGSMRPGTVTFSTAVEDNNYQPVLDCVVTVLVTSLDTGEVVELSTTDADPLNDFEHKAVHQIKETGNYRISVNVIDPQGNGGQTEFDIEVTDVSLLMKIEIYFAMIFTGFAGLMLIKKGFVLFGLWKPRKGYERPSVPRPAR